MWFVRRSEKLGEKQENTKINGVGVRSLESGGIGNESGRREDGCGIGVHSGGVGDDEEEEGLDQNF